jgi:hypothetical protein
MLGCRLAAERDGGTTAGNEQAKALGSSEKLPRTDS